MKFYNSSSVFVFTVQKCMTFRVAHRFGFETPTSISLTSFEIEFSETLAHHNLTPVRLQS